ncbi:MAG: helix-turn-helix domain-containing protein [Dysgonamonadaceae bacterium]|jgi:transcriptional regulator with XRE-family HTH domain|nr:helix-turn-helix domain-containing protein [Dysgonamonadaceae bacterium]
MKSEIGLRIKELREYLKLTQTEFSAKIGIKQANLSHMESYGNKISIEIINKIISNFNITSEWLLTGKGEMLRADNQTSGQRKLIPFYDVNVEAGTMQVSNMDAVSEPDEWIDAGDWFLDADSAMRVHGDSMFPLYKSGSIVVMREVHNKGLIVYGRDYVIQTSEYKVIKRLQKSDMPGCWLACSVNDETWEKGELAGRLIHEPFDVEIDCVNKIFMVLGCVSRNESSKIVNIKNKK